VNDKKEQTDTVKK